MFATLDDLRETMQQICGKQAPLEPNKLSGVLVELAAIVGRSGSGKSSLMAMAVIDAATDDLIGILRAAAAITTASSFPRNSST